MSMVMENGVQINQDLPINEAVSEVQGTQEELREVAIAVLGIEHSLKVEILFKNM